MQISQSIVFNEHKHFQICISAASWENIRERSLLIFSDFRQILECLFPP